MERCIVCLKDDFYEIPYLKCGHVVCSECYCKLKAIRPNRSSSECPCPLCKKNMIRSYKKRINKFYKPT